MSKASFYTMLIAILALLGTVFLSLIFSMGGRISP